MADAVVARWHGDNYQARVFWNDALNLLLPDSCVVEVTFEANGPKAFDDVVVKYDPPVPRSGPDRISAEYQQIKWHVERGGRFGYEDFIKPDFMGARSFSLLERLQEARRIAPASAQFTFLTTYRIKDGDPLAVLISGNDKTLLAEASLRRHDRSQPHGKGPEVLARTPRPERRRGTPGRRETVFRVDEGHRSLQELREQINFKAHAVGFVRRATLPILTSDTTNWHDN